MTCYFIVSHTPLLLLTANIMLNWTIQMHIWYVWYTQCWDIEDITFYHFYYCSMVWHFSSKQDSDKLDLLNKRILRFIFKDFNSEYNNLLKKAGTANLKDKRLQNMILTIFKCLHFSDYPRYLKDMFRLRSSTYFLRGHNMLCLPKPLTTSYGINSFSYLAATSWNSLPDHYRTISDFTSFRQLISMVVRTFQNLLNLNSLSLSWIRCR